MKRNGLLFIMALGLLFGWDTCSYGQEVYHEKFRSQIHFSPQKNWTNDPNGMVYYKGVYHLFYQYYPNGTTWGPMHWGHAISHDLVHWQQLPIALYPDSLGYIFSGSVVVDKNNTSGLGKGGIIPLVAIYTSHNPKKREENNTERENQSIAFSLDEGKTWTKYSANPVLKNPGIVDFRDPKVMWYEQEKKWIMTLATKDRITFYSSANLKSWKKESEFGKEEGAHGGVWECPDLFSLENKGKKTWVLIVNVNPGGPNKGSATQYFLGSFNGKEFKPYSTKTRWLDYGPDEYAGVTWSNTGSRKIFLGWMSNWLYANVIPESTWRNAMTVPRELALKDIGGELFVTSKPVSELGKIEEQQIVLENIDAKNGFDLGSKLKGISIPCRLDFHIQSNNDFSLTISNDKEEELIIGYEKAKDQFYIDRQKSGITGFQKDFAGIHIAPKLVKKGYTNISLILDVSSVELFADDGLTVMSEIFFPDKNYDKISIKSANGIFKKIRYVKYKGIW